IAEMPGTVVAGAVEPEGSPHLGADCGVLAGLPANNIAVTSDAGSLVRHADAILDFTAPAATVALASLAAASGLVHVIGTTGLSSDDDRQIEAASGKTAIVKSGNMSLGVNLLATLVERIAASLDADFDVEIVEMHHNRKVDAPSGTALLLGEAAA